MLNQLFGALPAVPLSRGYSAHDNELIIPLYMVCNNEGIIIVFFYTSHEYILCLIFHEVYVHSSV